MYIFRIVTVDVKAREVTVTGPRGTLYRNLRHTAIDIQPEGNRLKVDMWHGCRKDIAKINTICSIIKNLITGVTIGFRYKMRFVYAHFPINVTCEPDGKSLNIRNFLGEKRIRQVTMKGDVKCYRGTELKDELVIEGTDLDLVSQCAAMVHHVCLVKNKDIRRFLDGIYVSEKGHIENEE